MEQIPYLKKGDLIQLVSPAKAIDRAKLEFAKNLLEKAGFSVILSRHADGKSNYFSGTDEQRLRDFQEALDNSEVKAILCTRGGYGTVRIVDAIQWANQLLHPKWIMGFSDITVFHQHLQSMKIPSIHATMPLNFEENSKEAIQTFIDALKGNSYEIQYNTSKFNKKGDVEAVLVGGNLSIICSLLGTNSQPDYSNKILYIEEIGEELYQIDRMLFSLRKAGVFDQIKGLIVGGMTNLKDNIEGGIGLTLEELVLQHFEYVNIPICFNFPAGHINDNRAIMLGVKARLTVKKTVKLKFDLISK